MEVLEFLKDYKSNPIEGLSVLREKFLIENKSLNGKVLLKYHRQSDKTLKMVRECRGLIVSELDLEVVSCPMEKFGNLGESYAANDIDITKCKTLEKLDGTFIGMYYSKIDNKWHVQTLKQVEAEQIVKGFSKENNSTLSWSNLFWSVFKNYTEISILETLDKDYTYMFELCTPWNRVVVQHNEPKLYFLGLRNKFTFKEDCPENCILYNIFDKPKIYEYKDIDEIVRIAREQLGADDEGFILVDENFRRVKIKSAEYVAQHYKSTVITINNIVEIVLQNEQDEWLITFPEYQDVVDIIKEEINILGKKIDDFYLEWSSKLKDKNDRKELALLLKDVESSGIEKAYIFQLLTGKIKSGVEGITFFARREEMTKKGRVILEQTDICKRVQFNINNGSLRG